MIKLISVIHDKKTNSVEATWVDRIETPAPFIEGQDVYIPPTITEVQVKCHSYADVQMQMFKDDITALGGIISEQADLIALVESKIVPYVAPTPSKPKLLVQIDKDTDNIYGAVLGNRAEEYTLAATEAKAYKAAGYTGTVPDSVQGWATAKNWTAKQSADDILLTATNWRSAQAAIRAKRLLCKEQVRNARDDAATITAITGWNDFVIYMRTQLGI